MLRSMSTAESVASSSSGLSRSEFMEMESWDSGLLSGRLQPVIALFFKFERKVRTARLDDAAVGKDVNHIGSDVIEQALVVSNEENAAVRTAHEIDAFGNDFKRVDVEARIGFVEHGIARLQHEHLENFVALLLAAGKSLVDAAAGERTVH